METIVCCLAGGCCAHGVGREISFGVNESYSFMAWNDEYLEFE